MTATLLMTAWATYRDAAAALDATDAPDHSRTVQALHVALDAAADTLASTTPTTPAGAAAALRYALDMAGEPAEADAARHDRPPADDGWSSDGFRVLYGVVKALEVMGRAQDFEAAMVALDREAAAGFTEMVAAFEADAPAMIPAVPTLAMVEAGAVAAGATHEAIRAAYAAMAATFRGAA